MPFGTKYLAGAFGIILVCKMGFAGTLLVMKTGGQFATIADALQTTIISVCFRL